MLEQLTDYEELFRMGENLQMQEATRVPVQVRSVARLGSFIKIQNWGARE